MPKRVKRQLIQLTVVIYHKHKDDMGLSVHESHSLVPGVFDPTQVIGICAWPDPFSDEQHNESCTMVKLIDANEFLVYEPMETVMQLVYGRQNIDYCIKSHLKPGK